MRETLSLWLTHRTESGDLLSTSGFAIDFVGKYCRETP